MARVFRVKGEARSAAWDGVLLVASTDGIYRLSDGVELIASGEGEAVDVLDGLEAYAIAGQIYFEESIPFEARVLDLSISPQGKLAVAGKRNEILVYDGEVHRIKLGNRSTGIDRINESTLVVATRHGRCLVIDRKRRKIMDELRVDRPFTTTLYADGRIYVGVSDGGIYRFKPGEEIEYVGEHVRRVFDLDYDRYLFSVGEDRFVKARSPNGLEKSRKLHFDTFSVASYNGMIAVVGPRYIWVEEIERL